MKSSQPSQTRVAIACGGTGGHLFPGLAVAEQLRDRGCAVILLISSKKVDQDAVRDLSGMDLLTLPAVALNRGGSLVFLRGFVKSYRAARRAFKPQPPHLALAMGGFTSAPPILAARRLGARVFLHESNTIPGRANRWLSWLIDEAFVGFGCAAPRLHAPRVSVTGTPVRRQFRSADGGACKAALGLDPLKPVVLVTGGSQGASGINNAILKSLPLLQQAGPDWQWVHLTGPADFESVQAAYAARHMNARVRPFLEAMDLALGAADAAVSRAGASSIAELAAVRLPAVLIPYPAAMDNHQWHNALELARSGAAHVLEEKEVTPERLAGHLQSLVEDPSGRENMRKELAKWDRPAAAGDIAEAMLRALGTAQVQPASLTQAATSARPAWKSGSNSGRRVMKGAAIG